MEEQLEKIYAEIPDDIRSYIKECMTKEHPESYLIDVLHKVQAKFGYLAAEKLEAVSYLMQIPSAKVSGMASFYHFFRLKPVGKYMINVCMGTSCHVKGADKLIDKVKEKWGVSIGEMSKDKLFSLDGPRCVGMCSLAPVVLIDEKFFSHVTTGEMVKIIESLKEEQENQ